MLQEGITRNLGDFARFLETASFSQGQVLNISQIARECSIERKTVANYFDILDDLLLSTRILPFTKRAKRKLISHPKFYYFDVGVYRTIRPKGPLDSMEEIDGPSIETLFLQHLLAINNYYRLGYNISFWRTQNQMEVDFVLYGEKGLHAFEIKRTNRINNKDLNGLKAFQDDIKRLNYI